jgi:HK97 family phage major capsid protein/HK97 family phage prohead protease
MSQVRHTHAYLHVKSFDVTGRNFAGMASTGEVDRQGDIVEPLGAEFKNPLPLLLHHNTQQPVGLVTLGKPTKDGIPFTATIPTIAEAGTLKDRTDEAAQSVLHKLIRGVSIGFRPIKDAIEQLKSGGLRFVKTEILELSMVSVPANQHATIEVIKSLDEGHAATGISPDVISPTKSRARDAIRAVPLRKDATMTLQEQITNYRGQMIEKSERMDAMLAKSAEDGSTFDEAQTEEYDTLKAEKKSIEAHLGRLEEAEERNKKAAVPVGGGTPEDGTKSRGGVTVSVKSNLPKGTGFTRFAMALAASRGSRYEAIEYAKRWQSSTPEIVDLLKIDAGMLAKAAVDAGTTTDATWAAPLVVYQNLANEFIELLRPATILGRIPNLRRVPFNVQMPRQTSGSTVNWVGQGKPKPVGELAFDTVSLGMSKAAGIIGMTEELVRSSSPSAEGIVRGDLIAAIAQFLDVRFLDPQYAAVANVSPAAITNGAAVVDSTGTTAAAFRTDVKSAFATFTAASLSIAGAVWIMTETQALALSMIQNALGQSEYPGITANGGTLFGLPVIVSENIPAEGGSPAGNRIILLKPSEILVADEGGVVIDVSREASVQMNTTPDDPASASTVMVSAWQNNLVFIRAERYLNWLRRRTAAVVVIEGAVYVG